MVTEIGPKSSDQNKLALLAAMATGDAARIKGREIGLDLSSLPQGELSGRPIQSEGVIAGLSGQPHDSTWIQVQVGERLWGFQMHEVLIGLFPGTMLKNLLDLLPPLPTT